MLKVYVSELLRLPGLKEMTWCIQNWKLIIRLPTTDIEKKPKPEAGNIRWNRMFSNKADKT